jgi:chromate transport protein ChrA
MENLKSGCDALSICGVIATLAGWLPSVAAAVSIVWTCIRIYETKTVQRWFRGEQ